MEGLQLEAEPGRFFNISDAESVEMRLPIPTRKNLRLGILI
jgi:hypothetical protein